MPATNIDRYLKDDTIFNKINKKFITLDSDNKKNNNVQLRMVFDSLIEAMKQESPLFKKTYQRKSGAGSYYKKTRVGEPEEYDFNFVINLPIKEKDMKFCSDCPGYIKIRTTWKDKDMSFKTLNLEPQALKELNSLIDDESYLNQEKFRIWMESILDKVARNSSGNYTLMLNGCIRITIRKTGPAFTLKIPGKSFDIDIDVVPVLPFSILNPPPKCSKKYILEKCSAGSRYWSVVPKPLNNSRNNFTDKRHRYWRLCFYEFEKDILDKNGRVKLIIRHLKKLRNTQKWKVIASYYIETLCMNELKTLQNLDKVSNTHLFFTMLQKLHEAFREGSIKYFWDEDLNLLEHIGFEEMKNMEGRINRIIKTIEKDIAHDKYAIARWVLSEDELCALINDLETSAQPSNKSSDLSESTPESTNQWSCVII